MSCSDKAWNQIPPRLSQSNKSHLVNGTRDSVLAQQCPVTVTYRQYVNRKAYVFVLSQLARHKKNTILSDI